MEEEIPPDIDADSSRDAEKTNRDADDAVVTTESPNINVIEARTPEKVIVAAPGIQSDAININGTPQKSIGDTNTPNDNQTPRKLRLLYENMRQRSIDLEKTRDSEKVEYERLLLEKDAMIKKLSARLEKQDVMKMNNKDVFVPKLRRGTTGATKNCEISGCSNYDVDLIKCNMCGVLACEECTGVKIAKLRPLMNQCKQLYITCHNCDLLIREESNVNAFDVLKGKLDAMHEELGNSEKENDTLKQQVNTLTGHQTSLQSLLEERESVLHEAETKIVSLEQGKSAPENSTGGAFNFEELINKRFDKIDKNIDALIEKKLAGAQSSVTEEHKKTFAQALGGDVTDTLTTAFRNRENQEKVNGTEREKRATNLIIYGVKEPSSELQKEDDETFVSSLLDIIGVVQRPKHIVRLGPRSDEKTRPVKLVMESENDKDTIMARLGNLKNAEDVFRKISIREDYTREEREMVRDMVKKAAEKNDAGNTQEWKVRGTPKTGLRLVKIAKRQ